MTGQEKATAASVVARKDKAARKAAYQADMMRYNRERVTLPSMPVGTPEQNAQLHSLWRRHWALQDRIKELHTLRGRTGSERRKTVLFDDLLAARAELADVTTDLKALRRKMVGAETLAKVDIPYPHPQDYGLKPEDVE